MHPSFKSLNTVRRKIKSKDFEYQVELGQEAIYRFESYIRSKEYPIPVTDITKPCIALINLKDELELIEINLSGIKDYFKADNTSEKIKLEKIISELKIYDTALKHGRARIEDDEIVGVMIKFNSPENYSHILLKDFISKLNKSKKYDRHSIVSVS